MTMAAVSMVREERPGQTREALGQKLKEITQMGVTNASIAQEAGVNRSYISQLINHGNCGCAQETIDQLWSWVDSWERAQGRGTVESGAAEFKRAPELIRTTALTATFGFVEECIREKKFGVIIGQPGAGKTTVIELVRSSHARVIVVEAWTSMRMSDLLRKIAAGLGIGIRGTLEEKKDQILEELTRHPDTILIVDESEYLKKWNVEKIDTLRKLQDNAGFTLLMFGTNLFRSVISNAALPQLQSRITCFDFPQTNPKEIREALNGYDIEPEAANRLAALAGNASHGGMRTYSRVLELCLYGAGGGRITMDILDEAIRHKPGL